MSVQRLFAAMLLFLALCLAPGQVYAQQGYQVTEQSSQTSATDWPKQFTSEGSTITLYQPTLDKWEGNQLSCRAAIAVTTNASATPTYGVVWFTARTDVDKETRQVTLNDVQITKLNLPAASHGSDYQKILQQNVSRFATVLPLDQIEAELAVFQAAQQQRKQPLKNEPPTIYFSTVPAVLVVVEGDPVLRAVPGTNLMRIINTRTLLVFDQDAAKYYLYLVDRWMESPSLNGPWTVTPKPTAALATAKQAALDGQTADLMDEPSPDVQAAMDNDTTPTVYVSTTPAELIVTTGKPKFQPIPGTNLLWATNTKGSLFMNVTDQSYYVLISGRWFRSKTMDIGSWQFVDGADLPKDFARIPENHPAGDALPSVPGTEEARQALIAQHIPQTATVRRDAAQLTVTYDGQPVFQAIEGTSLQYAVNTPTPVIMVDPNTYYACQDGVWFTGGSPQGPWVVADSVPPAIYTIPVSCPINYVTNAFVYGSTPDVVYVGYTPGYLGTYVEPYGCVVYGSGYVYPGWTGAVWFGGPITFGFGAVFDWTLGYGWSFGFGFGAGSPWRPWWGPWWGQWRYHEHGNAPWKHGNGPWRFHDANMNHHNVYNRWDHQVVAARPRTAYKPMAAGATSTIISGRDGNVYRRGQNGWEVRQGSTWKPVGGGKNGVRPAVHPGGTAESPEHLNRVRQADAQAKVRTDAVNQAQKTGTAPQSPPKTMTGHLLPPKTAPQTAPSAPQSQPQRTSPPRQTPPQQAPQRTPPQYTPPAPQNIPSYGGTFGGAGRRDNGGGYTPPRNNGGGGGYTPPRSNGGGGGNSGGGGKGRR